LPLADVSFGDLLLTVFEISLFVIWIWILFTIIGDLFRDHDMSGFAKAIWIIFLVFIPYISMLVYLIARGSGMRERALKAQSEAKHQFDSYVQEQAHTSPADELHKGREATEDAEHSRNRQKTVIEPGISRAFAYPNTKGVFWRDHCRCCG